MKMLPHQFDTNLIEASRLYKKYARAVFPQSAKKCEIFFGTFAHIFHKCKTAFNSSVFYLHKRETTFNFSVFYLHKRETTFNFSVCFLLEPHKLQKVSDLQRDDLLVFEITCQITEKIDLQHGTMTFFSFWRSVFCSITKPQLRHFCKNFRTLLHFLRRLCSRENSEGTQY